VLWKPEGFEPLKGNPVNSLIQKVVMQERGGEDVFSVDQYGLKWTFANEYDIIFVVSLDRLSVVVCSQHKGGALGCVPSPVSGFVRRPTFGADP
jgi:hypothetical protein